MIHLLKRNLASEILDSIDHLKDGKQIPEIVSNFQAIETSLEIPKNKAISNINKWKSTIRAVNKFY